MSQAKIDDLEEKIYKFEIVIKLMSADMKSKDKKIIELKEIISVYENGKTLF